MEINLEPSGETEPVPMASGETEINLEPSGEEELSPKGVGRGGTKLLSLEQGMKRRPYASRSFSHLVVIGSTFWGTPVLGPRQFFSKSPRYFADQRAAYVLSYSLWKRPSL